MNGEPFVVSWPAEAQQTARNLTSLCYKFVMAKTTEQWLLFKYFGLEFTPLSKPFKTKKQAEQARLKYAERDRGAIGIGVIRTKS